MNKKEIIEKTKQHVQQHLSREYTGHDWWHCYRVWRLSRHIVQSETCDLFIVELASLLHDIADHKFHGGNYQKGTREADKFLSSLEVEKIYIEHVCSIIDNISFSKGKVPPTLEGQIVQDADRLDAIGAMGIARAFAYGGYAQRELYNPGKKPNLFHRHEVKNKENTTINHFYEKLLLLKNKMNTKTGYEMAQERHQFMLGYLEKFFTEWEGIE